MNEDVTAEDDSSTFNVTSLAKQPQSSPINVSNETK